MRFHRDPLYMGQNRTQKCLETNTSQVFGNCGSLSPPPRRSMISAAHDRRSMISPAHERRSMISSAHEWRSMISSAHERIYLPFWKTSVPYCLDSPSKQQLIVLHSVHWIHENITNLTLHVWNKNIWWHNQDQDSHCHLFVISQQAKVKKAKVPKVYHFSSDLPLNLSPPLNWSPTQIFITFLLTHLVRLHSSIMVSVSNAGPSEFQPLPVYLWDKLRKWEEKL